MSATILVVDDVDSAREAIADSLRKDGKEVLEAGTLKKARQYLEESKADICVLDIKLPDGNGLSLLDEVVKMSWQPKFIVITAYGEIDNAVEAMKKGAIDFFTKPINDLKALKKSIERAEELIAMQRELNHLRSAQTATAKFIIGKHPRMQALVELAQRAAGQRGHGHVHTSSRTSTTKTIDRGKLRCYSHHLTRIGTLRSRS